MKKEIDITMLMDNYTDNEFNIGGEAGVEEEKVLSAVMPQVKPKKKIKPLFKALIAAAAAAVVVLAGTVAASNIVIRGGYKTPTGITVSYWFTEGGGSWSTHYDEDRGTPIKVEEGNRLMFVALEENVDITDLVDGDTPYIYSYDNSNGDACYIIVGGEAGDYGYIEAIPMPMGEDLIRWCEHGWNTHVPKEQWKEYPEDIIVYGDDENGEEKWAAYHKAEDEAKRSWFKPWCLAALDELGIWDSISERGENVYDPILFNESIGYDFGDEYIGEN